ncbi:hypothetical protein M758_6G009300 [Ceratodon purpureus]|uniref:Uncharacterized protein n=1 Tax=Ceratodon purpureus TaxID=3225 RepID=A0A8T0HGW3_CERPU|nr:hypothetical protein KC19_6G011100 [Ceratodon purpureus]KAG0612196.1 hypothetical protein M758_6G009300 [Ceratodon purpureus]
MEHYTMISSTYDHHIQDVDVELSDLKPQRLEASPEIASFGDGHRCKRFPCPICNQGRSRKIMLQLIPDQVDAVPLLPRGRDDQAAPLVHISFGDGGHTCRRFPCPICQQGR